MNCKLKHKTIFIFPLFLQSNIGELIIPGTYSISIILKNVKRDKKKRVSIKESE